LKSALVRDVLVSWRAAGLRSRPYEGMMVVNRPLRP